MVFFYLVGYPSCHPTADYDRSRASPVGLQDHVICYSGLWVAAAAALAPVGHFCKFVIFLNLEEASTHNSAKLSPALFFVPRDLHL